MEVESIIKTYGNKDLPDAMPERPLVTFAVFAYNQEKYIQEAIEGAFSQTYSPLEIILSDDCSSDRTYEIMEEMANAYNGPHMVKVRRQHVNSGTLAHLLSVSRQVQGDFLIFAAGDDISFPERTSFSISEFLKAPDSTVVLSADDIIFSNEGKVINSEEDIRNRRRWFCERKAWYHGATACYRTSILKHLPNPTNRILFEDMALMDIFSGLGYTSRRIECPLIVRRMHEKNVGPLRYQLTVDEWTKEEGRLMQLREVCLAMTYAAMVIASLGGNSRELREKSDFLAYYSKWPEMNILHRASLVMKSIQHGYGKSAFLRLFGKRGFLFAKKIVSSLGI